MNNLKKSMSKLKRAIFQLYIGEPNPMYDISVKTFGDYARKIGADHIVATTPKINSVSLLLEKFQLLDFFEGELAYDRILYVDADVLPTPHAADIFQEYQDPEFFYAFDENFNTRPMNRDTTLNKMGELGFEWKKNDRGMKQYFNAGVFLISKDNCDFLKDYRQLPELPNLWEFGDQNYMNYLVMKHGVKFQSLDYSFNRMDLGSIDENKERYKANFIHYAGPSRYGDKTKSKIENFVADYEVLYG